MVFSSTVFLFYFLPVFLIVYFLIPKSIKLKNIWFLIASLFFYFWGEISFIYVLILSIVLNYLVGLWLHRAESKYVLWLGIVLNLTILVGYKYLSFLISNFLPFIDESTHKGLETWLSIHLPLGISFFTFQGMSYLIDVYKKDALPEKSFFNLALYIGMFPQLIAGPIVRFKEIAAQIKKRTHSIEKVSFGITLFIIGFGYKILIANTMGAKADMVFNYDLELLTSFDAWAGALFYTLQIYFDFCGYSTMAIGLGLILGLKFPKNFNFPYISRSITEFWRRWHITLSSWFRDYLYIPLGGNRHGNFRTYSNLFTVFVLCGIWHGASWVFLIWGIYHGFFLVIERLGLGKILKTLPIPINNIYTLVIVVIGWVFFRAESLTQATSIIKKMFIPSGNKEVLLHTQNFINNEVTIVFLLGCFLSTPLINYIFFGKGRKWSTLMDLEKMPKTKFDIFWKIFLLIVFIIALSKLVNESYNPFIYFRF